MFDYERVKDEVITYTGQFSDDFDVEGIMDELRDMGVESINDVETDDLIEILKRHDGVE